MVLIFLSFQPSVDIKYNKDVNFFITVRLDILPNYECFFPEYTANKYIEFKLEQINLDLYEKKTEVPMGAISIDKVTMVRLIVKYKIER